MPMEPYESIFQQFPPATPDEWKDKIIQELKGEPFQKLIQHTKEGIEILPFYTKEDNQKYQLDIPAKNTKGWLITEKIQVNEIETSNQLALEALKMGANTNSSVTGPFCGTIIFFKQLSFTID